MCEGECYVILNIRGVSWRRKDKLILNQVSWQIHSGEHWCLVGLNGSGKTTLLNIINGYIWPTEGTVTVLGHTYGQVRIPEFRKRIGWVSSSLKERFHVHEATEEIVLGGKFATIGLHDEVGQEDIHKAIELMAKLGCEGLRGREFATLSQGEQQKILIARALIAGPDILILDEPCTGLDLLAREQLLSMIDTLTQQENGPALIYVTHHIEEILSGFTHTLLLKQGEVYDAGVSSEIVTTEALSGFFEVPIEVHERGKRKWAVLNNKEFI